MTSKFGCLRGNVTTKSSRWSIAEERAGAIGAPELLDVAFDALLGAIFMVVAEWALVSWSARAEFAGLWEFKDAFVGLVPVTWILASVAALLGAFLLAAARRRSALARGGAAIFGAAIALAIGIGITRGRHFAALGVRVAFVAGFAAVVFLAVYRLLPLIARRVDAAPRGSAIAFAIFALALGVANQSLLPRLYPAFHLGLALLTAMSAAPIGRGLRAAIGPPPKDARRTGPVLALGLLAVAAALTPGTARGLARADNVRLIFLDRAPLLGLGVTLGARLAPPPPEEPAIAVEEERAEGRLAVDWRHRDIVLLTVDALRADHVGAYGYGRKTTPAIDQLASEGTLFERAYCPTPHTSYSVSSLMTGKNLRPLLAQGLGADSDTLAELLRTYGYRTAAFYPPAVFFIDEELFAPFRDRHLDFEYARVEFADPAERARAVDTYLRAQGTDQRLFLWVHLFEPHEPYVAHEAYPFGDRDVDRYDSEIALADAGIGQIVNLVRAVRPGATVILTADHGEEFGDHRGRYHGTTVYEEQVRVPLIVTGPGVARGRRVETPVQTIDLLPTVLGALDIPRPPRVGGHDLGPWLRAIAGRSSGGESAASSASAEPVLRDSTPQGPSVHPAVAETDDQILLAEGPWRLVCARRASACALYDLDHDPGEIRDVAPANDTRFQGMKAALRRIESTQGRYEIAAAHNGARSWPVAIRRGIAGDAEAALEIAALLDDSDVTFRRKAAEVLFDLKRRATLAQLRLAEQRDDDEKVRNAAALALARLGETLPSAIALLNGPDVEARRLAALGLAENGDPRGAAVLTSWWQAGAFSFLRAREILGAFAKLRAKEAVPALITSLDDVRLRPYVAATLAAIGQISARPRLALRFATERQKDTRSALASALVALGANTELVLPLTRFLGTPDPLPDGLDLARRAGILALIGGATDRALAGLRSPGLGAELRLVLPSMQSPHKKALRVLVRGHTLDGAAGQMTLAACSLPWPAEPLVLDFPDATPREAFASLSWGANETTAPKRAEICVSAKVSANLAVEALAVVPLADELPPPPPEPWEAQIPLLEGAASAPMRAFAH